MIGTTAIPYSPIHPLKFHREVTGGAERVIHGAVVEVVLEVA